MPKCGCHSCPCQRKEPAPAAEVPVATPIAEERLRDSGDIEVETMLLLEPLTLSQFDTSAQTEFSKVVGALLEVPDTDVHVGHLSIPPTAGQKALVRRKLLGLRATAKSCCGQSGCDCKKNEAPGVLVPFRVNTFANSTAKLLVKKILSS